MKKILPVLFLLFTASAFSQVPLTILRPLDSLPTDVQRFVGRDQFTNFYFISENVFTKFNGKNTLDYKNISKGSLAYVDVHNPLLILLFYKDFNSIVLLDDQLNEVRQINFNENTEFPLQVHAAGIASQNRMWIYDSLKQQILLYDYNQNTYRTITASFPGNLRHYESDFNEFRWIDDNRNMFFCDIYGKITSWGKVPAFDKCAIVSRDRIIYQIDEKIYLHSITENKSTLIELNEKSFKSFYYKDQILSIFTKHGITNYKILLP